jgi:RimJ/RimL family protein N-acetyltransferase
MSVQVDRIGPDDETALAAYCDVYDAALRHGPAGAVTTPWQPEEIRIDLRDPDPRTVRRAWTGAVDGRVVATGWLRASTVDNTDLAEVLVCCAPGDRGHGYAAEVLAHVEAEARALGRSRLVGEVTWPHDQGADGAGSSDLAWALARGFSLDLVDVQRRLALPLADERLDTLAAEAAEHHAGYTLRSFAGPVPDDVVEEWAALQATLMTEAPMGDIEREAEDASVDALRAREALLAEMGRTKVSTGAVAPDGRLAAYTDIALTVHEAERAYQWGTLVDPAHRGHRLGLAVKVANLRLLQQAHPQITTVVTYNADVNAPMVAVNEHLGFRPVAWMGELQKRL